MRRMTPEQKADAEAVPRMAVVQDLDTGEALTKPMDWDQADRIARAPSVVGRNVAAVYVS